LTIYQHIDNIYLYSIIRDEYLASKGYRFSIVNNYLMFFVVNEKQIEIIRFLYGYRDWIKMLEK